MKHLIKHDLDHETAKKVATAAFESYQKRFEKYEPEATWSSENLAEFSFKAKGISLRGKMLLEEKGISLDLKVPIIFKLIKKKALAVIEEEVQIWIEKANNGEL